MKTKNLRLILASQSPRRREILESAGFKFMTSSSNSSESFDENLTLEENLCEIAETKVQIVFIALSPRKRKGILILGADTVVVVGRQVLGKPKNARDARRMLGLLSGKTHRVMTSFSLYAPDESRCITHVVTTKVGFHKLSTEDIQRYVDTKEPFDKAGAYAIQGGAQQFVNFVDGDLLNVIGLPLNAVKRELRKQRWNVAVTRPSSNRLRKNRSS